MNSHPLSGAIRTANMVNAVQFLLGALASAAFLLIPIPSDAEGGTIVVFLQMLLVAITAWNSRRELRLIPTGRTPKVFFYLSNLAVILCALLVLSGAVAAGRTLPSSPDLFLLLAMTFPSVYSLRVAARVRELRAAGEIANKQC